MTKFIHQKRSGRHKKPKDREPRGTLGIGKDMERLIVHRELEALRRPTGERFYKLDQARSRASREVGSDRRDP